MTCRNTRECRRERGFKLEKRRVTVTIGGQPCSFYSNDPDEYVEELAARANDTLKQVQGSPARAVLLLTDMLMRAEKEKTQKTESDTAEIRADVKTETKTAWKPEQTRKNTSRSAVDNGQVSVWDLL